MPRALVVFLLPLLLLSQAPTGDSPPSPAIPPELQVVWQQYEQLVREYPDHPLLHYNFGNLAYGAGEYQKALHEYQAALKTGDREAQARVFYNLGNSLFRSGNIEDSRSFYRKALELNPDDEDARVNYELALRLAEQQPRQEEIQSPARKPDAEKETPDPSGQESSQDQSGSQEDQSGPEEQQEDSRAQQEQEEAIREQMDEQSAADQQQVQPRDDLKREEAEAILNALRADEENLMKRTYRPPVSIKLEKDW